MQSLVRKDSIGSVANCSAKMLSPRSPQAKMLVCADTQRSLKCRSRRSRLYKLRCIPGSPAPSVHLFGKDNALNESHFMVERKSGTGIFEMVRNMTPFDPNQKVNQYHDSKVVSGVAYAYRVSAVAIDGQRTFSAASSITLL